MVQGAGKNKAHFVTPLEKTGDHKVRDPIGRARRSLEQKIRLVARRFREAEKRRRKQESDGSKRR